MQERAIHWMQLLKHLEVNGGPCFGGNLCGWCGSPYQNILRIPWGKKSPYKAPLYKAFVNIYHETCLGQSFIAWSQVVVIIDMSGTLFMSITMVGSWDG